MADWEATRKTENAICVSKTPDFCKSPSAPVAYNIVGEFIESIRTASTVRMTQCRAFTSNSRIGTVKGNEGGVGGGVKSAVNLGFCKPIKEWSTTVKTEGHFTCRHDTLMEMNCAGPDGPGNTFGKVVYVECYSCATVTPSGEIKIDRPKDGESADSTTNPKDSAPPNNSAPSSEPSSAAKPMSSLQQQAQDIRNAGTELANQATAVKDAVSGVAENAIQSAKNIYENPGIVLDNLERIGNQVGDYASSRLNDPNLLLNDASAIGDSVGSNLQQMGNDVVDGVSNNQPLTAIAKVGPKLFGMVSGAVGAAKLAAGVTKMVVKDGKALIGATQKVNSKLPDKTLSSAGSAGANGTKVAKAPVPALYYPPNRGFAGKPVRKNLQPGERVERIGDGKGSFGSPEGTPIGAKSLPPDAVSKPMAVYEVKYPVSVDAGPAAPAFGQPGGGMQYDFGGGAANITFDDLVSAGILKPVE